MFDCLVPAALADAATRHLQHEGAGRGAIVAGVGCNSREHAADGQILLKMAYLMRGCHRQAAPSLDAKGWSRTGDLAARHENGFCAVAARGQVRKATLAGLRGAGHS